jgi:hypothetical protein
VATSATRSGVPVDCIPSSSITAQNGQATKDVAEPPGATEQSLRTRGKRDQLERHECDDGLTLAEREELRRLRRENKRLDLTAQRPTAPRCSAGGRSALPVGRLGEIER